MKKLLLLVAATCASLNLNSTVHAAPTNAKHRSNRTSAVYDTKSTRRLMILELTGAEKAKTGSTQTPKDGSEFRSYYETHVVNPG